MEWVLSSFKCSIFHSAAKNMGGAHIDCLLSFLQRKPGHSAVPCAEWMEGAPCPKLLVMKKTNIGKCHDRHTGLSQCRNRYHAHHAGMTLMGLKRSEEAAAVKSGSRGWPCCVLSRKVRGRRLKWITKVKWEAVGRAENRAGAAFLPVSASSQDCHSRPCTC